MIGEKRIRKREEKRNKLRVKRERERKSEAREKEVRARRILESDSGMRD